MKLRLFGIIVLALLAGLSPASAQIPIPPGWQPERAVVLIRHGVRAPLESNEQLDRHVATPWPVWPVPPGYLTPHGAELMRLMGGYYRALNGGRGLTQTDDCPPAGTVAAWADTEQRTRESGAALLLGMYPRCANLAPRHQADLAAPDPLFHPQPTPSCPMDCRQQPRRRAGPHRRRLQFGAARIRAAALADAGHALPARAGGRPAQCGLPAEAPAVQAGPDGGITIAGPIAHRIDRGGELRDGECRGPAR